MPIYKFHSWTKLPIRCGEPIMLLCDVRGNLIARRPNAGEKHTIFAAEDINQLAVHTIAVKSNVDITLVYNYKK